MAAAFVTFSQQTGRIAYVDGDLSFVIGFGWAGNGQGKNNHAMQAVRSVGPLPCGWYSIGDPQDHPTVGPFSLRLTPDSGNEMFGRDGFLIHGASKDPAHYGQESKGCIVASRAVRVKIHELGIKRLLVTK